MQASKTARDWLARDILASLLCGGATIEVLKRAGLASMAAAERVRAQTAAPSEAACPRRKRCLWHDRCVNDGMAWLSRRG